ncbi:MAG: hypothetical protein CMJ48_04040 [Planctomycetaceae bacterium]|nr:hypothetical protein [Planctomycetaceae bacterium]
MSNSKDAILNAIRQQPVPAVDLPDLQGSWTQYDDRPAQFAATVEAVAGHCLSVAGLQEAAEHLAALEHYASADRICSLVTGLESRDVSLETIDDPHELESVDWAIVPGEFGVAENGAVWVRNPDLKHRALLVIVQHLVLVLQERDIVNNMHEAYARLGFAEPEFGMFVSGPSKTADIEQSLVIGAHGARSLTVCVVGP